MDVKQIKGNTWAIYLPETVCPFYRLDGRRIVLFDSGQKEDRGELIGALESEGL